MQRLYQGKNYRNNLKKKKKLNKKQITTNHIIPATATPDTTLKQIIDIMMKEDTHRVWILQSEDAQKVIGVVTMSDIMGLLCANSPPSLF